MERSMRAWVTKQDTPESLGIGNTVAALGAVTYSQETLRMMRFVNVARENYAVYKAGLVWLQTLPYIPRPPIDWLSFPNSYTGVRRYMKMIDLAGREASMLSFCARELIDSDSIISTLKITQENYDQRVILFLPPSITTVPQLYKDLSCTPAIQELSRSESLTATGSLAPLLFVALHFESPDHWCGIVVDFEANVVIAFDPYQDRKHYASIDNWIGSYLLPAVPRLGNARFTRFKTIQQSDSYNCGVFVLLFFECCVFNSSGLELHASHTPALINHARYRYLAMNLTYAFGTPTDVTEDADPEGSPGSDEECESGKEPDEENARSPDAAEGEDKCDSGDSLYGESVVRSVVEEHDDTVHDQTSNGVDNDTLTDGSIQTVCAVVEEAPELQDSRGDTALEDVDDGSPQGFVTDDYAQQNVHGDHSSGPQFV